MVTAWSLSTFEPTECCDLQALSDMPETGDRQATRSDMARWIAIPAAILLAGLVLPTWYLIAPPPPGLPGLGSFPSASIGDTVLIPLSAFLLVLAIRRRPRAPHERILTGLAAIAAAAVGSAAQASWLHDRRPRPNWTLPRPGHFTAAGWWHAAYFVATSALFFALTVLLVLRVREERRKNQTSSPPSPRPGTPVLIAATGTYLALAGHDSAAGKPGWASGSSLILVGVALVAAAVLTGLALGRASRILLRPSLLGLAATAALTTLTIGIGATSPLFTATAAVILLTLALVLLYDLASTWSSPPPVLERAVNALVTTVGCAAAWTLLSHQAARHELRAALTSGAVAIVLLLGVMIGVLRRKPERCLPFTLLYTFGIGVAVTAVWLDARPADVASFTPYLALGVSLLLAIGTRIVQAYTDVELGVPKSPSAPSERLSDAKVARSTLALALLALFGVGSFLATLAFTIAANPGTALPHPRGVSTGDVILLGAMTVSAGLALALFAANSRPWPWLRPVTWAAEVALPVGLSVPMILAVSALPLKAPVATTAVSAAVMVALWTADSLFGNVWQLQGRSFGIRNAIPVLSLALLWASTTAWILTAGTRTAHGGRGLVEAYMIATALLLTVVAFTTLLGGAASRRLPRLSELPPWRGLLQDGSCVSGIILIIVFLSAYMINNVGFTDGLKLSIPLVALFGPPYYWIMKANREWPEIEARRLLESDAQRVLDAVGDRSWRRFVLDLRTQRTYCRHPVPQARSEEFVRALGAHTRNQNRIASALLLTPIASALLLLIGLFRESGQLKDLLDKMTKPADP
jgi:hypothetical protein